MYLVGISWHFWYDTVVKSTGIACKPWDLIQETSGIFLCIWKDISYQKLYTNLHEKDFSQATVLYKSILSEKVIDMIHWLVKTYFSSYKNVCNIFLPDGIENRLPKKPTKSKESEKLNIQQTCIIFPDLRTLSQTYPPESLDEKIAILHGGMTVLQKTKLFRAIKQGSITTLLATNRGLFFDRYNLKAIQIYSPTNRAYSALSDPRFVIKETAEKYASQYQAELLYK